MTIDLSFFQNRRVLVTGADGFIGSHLAERLTVVGASVRALACYNSFGSAGWLDSPDVAPQREQIDIVHGDIRDPYFVSEIVDGVDIVFHLAALIAIPFSYIAPQSYVETNITGTLNVLEACRRHKIKRMVHTSTSEVYGSAKFTPITENHPLQGQSPYSASKIGADHMAEAYFKSFDLPVAILRPFNTFGPRQSERAVIPTAIRQLLDPACEVVKLGDLEPVRDFNFVENIVDAYLHIGTVDQMEFGTPYNAGSGRGVTIREVVELLQKISNSDKPIATEKTRKRPVKSEVLTLVADADKLRQTTGWHPQIDIEAGLSRTVNWWRKEIFANRHRIENGYLT